MTETASVDDRASIAEHVRASVGRLTAQERKAAQVLLTNYPAAGLAPVAEFAERARVSAPTVLRFVAKLGFLGYPDFQRQLREELEAQLASPLAKPARKAGPRSPQRPFIDPFAEAAVANLQGTFRNLPEDDFSAIVELLCDRRRSVHLIGGRFTDALARYLAAHLSLVRPDVRHVPSGIGVWRDRLLDIRRRDVADRFRYPTLSGGRRCVRAGRGGAGGGDRAGHRSVDFAPIASGETCAGVSSRGAFALGLQRRSVGGRRSPDRSRDRAAWRIRQEEDRGAGEAALRRPLPRPQRTAAVVLPQGALQGNGGSFARGATRLPSGDI